MYMFYRIEMLFMLQAAISACNVHFKGAPLTFYGASQVGLLDIIIFDKEGAVLITLAYPFGQNSNVAFHHLHRTPMFSICPEQKQCYRCNMTNTHVLRNDLMTNRRCLLKVIMPNDQLFKLNTNNYTQVETSVVKLNGFYLN